jgi:hypothetical protein
MIRTKERLKEVKENFSQVKRKRREMEKRGLTIRSARKMQNQYAEHEISVNRYVLSDPEYSISK